MYFDSLAVRICCVLKLDREELMVHPVPYNKVDADLVNVTSCNSLSLSPLVGVYEGVIMPGI